MTTTTPSSGGIRVPAYLIILVVLFTALGALLMLSSTVDPKSLVRAANTLTPSITFTPSITPTPINPFATLRYIAWASADNLVRAEIPELWLPQSIQDSPVAYSIAIPGEQVTRIEFLVLPIAQLGIQGAPENATPDQLLKAAFATQENITVREVSTKTLKGAGVKQTLPQTNQTTGQSVNFDRDLWLLSLDAQNVILLQAISPTEQWPEMQKVFDHFVGSVEVNPQGIVALLNQAFGQTPVAPSGTQAATAAATTEAAATPLPPSAIVTATPVSPSAIATPIPTVAPAPTTEATTAPTAEATTEATAEPTAEATQAP